jgi:glycosyltransferase involved in cell wall biosynthesis
VRIVVVGSGRSVHTLARSAAVAARGHAVRLVTAGPAGEARGVEVRTRPVPTALTAPFAAIGFLRDIRSFRPDVLHLHYAGGKLGTLALLSGVHPLVVTVMGGDVLPEQHLGGLSPWELRTTRRVLREADVILAKSDALRPAIRALGGAEDKIEVVRWGVDSAVFRRDEARGARLRVDLGLAAGDRVILSPRILAPLYNTHLLVEAMPAVLARVPQAVLLLTEYGADPAYRAAVSASAGRLLGDRVRLIGRRPHEEMPALYSLAEAVVSVPSSDGLPQSLFETMACGTPAVLGRLPAYGEVVRDGESALLVAIEAPAIAAGLARLLEDRALAQRLADTALQEVRRSAMLPREAARVEALYEDARRRPARRSARLPRAVDALSLLWR